MKPRLLVRLPSWLGDLVAAEPVVRALHAEHAAAGEADRLSLAAPRHLLAVLSGVCPGARRIPHEGRGGERAADWRGHDAALLLTGSFRSAWTAWRAGIPRRVGWARDGRGPWLTDSMRPARERGGVPLGLGVAGRRPRYLPRPFGAACIELAGLLGVAVHDARPRLHVGAEARSAARARRAALGLPPDEPFVLVNAGARPGSAKGYPAERWGAVIQSLASQSGLAALVVGGPGEEAALRAAAQAARPARAFALDAPVCDVPGLAAHASEAALVLSADTGPRHVAQAVGARVVVVAGPTDPRHSAEHLEQVLLVREEVPCGPCHKERCPLAGEAELACLLRIDPARIAAAALALLARPASPSAAPR